jgi:hypothetical protein
MPQIWDKNLPSTSRFTMLPEFNNEAVRDNNTGLVWERTPGGGGPTWADTVLYCLRKPIGGTMGWRLPSIVELTSLMDPTLMVSNFLPPGVFGGAAGLDFWSATTVADDPSRAWILSFQLNTIATSPKTTSMYAAWCVRGPMNADQY